MSVKAFARLGRRRITANEGPWDNGGEAGVSEEAPAAGACIGIAEAAGGGAALDAAGAEAAGGGALPSEHAAQATPSRAIAESFTKTFMRSP
jgi:hypothetical protein